MAGVVNHSGVRRWEVVPTQTHKHTHRQEVCVLINNTIIKPVQYKYRHDILYGVYNITVFSFSDYKRRLRVHDKSNWHALCADRR